MSEDQAYRVMITAHQRGACVVAVYAKDIAETKATRATDAGRKRGLSAALHHRAGGIGEPGASDRSLHEAERNAGCSRARRSSRIALPLHPGYVQASTPPAPP